MFVTMEYELNHVQRPSVSHSSARNTRADDCLDGTTLKLLHVAPRKCRLSENIRRRGISSRGNRFAVPHSGSCTRKYMHSDRNFTAPHAINFGTVNYHSELSSTQ